MVVIANACGAVALLLRHSTANARSQHLTRLIVASIVAGMVYLQLMLPCFPQLLDYFKTERALGETRLSLAQKHGCPSARRHSLEQLGPSSAGYQELQWAADAHPHLFLLLRSAALACLVLWGSAPGTIAARQDGSSCRAAAAWSARLYDFAQQESLPLRMVFVFHPLRLRRVRFAVGLDWLAEHRPAASIALLRRSSGRARRYRLLVLPPSRSAAGL